jgi:hypothetical protein
MVRPSLRFLEINNEFDIRRLQDWQVCGLLAFENTSSVESGQPVHLRECAQDAQMRSSLHCRELSCVLRTGCCGSQLAAPLDRNGINELTVADMSRKTKRLIGYARVSSTHN